MRVAASFLPDPRRITPRVDVAIVIDVLRATSVMATALAAGAREIMTCSAVAEAQQLAETIDPRPLLCGERECRPIDHFDLGNSPAEYLPKVVAGQSLILTTTNGTAAIAAAAAARRVMTASFLNASATADAMDATANVHLICAGTNGAITAEDVLLAGYLIQHWRAHGDVEIEGDEAAIAGEFWRGSGGEEETPLPPSLSQRLRETQGGRNLVRAGYEADLDRCAAIDSQPVVVVQRTATPATFESSVVPDGTSGRSTAGSMR